MTELLQDTGFWVLISFVIFVGVFLKYGKEKVLASIDGKIDAIKTELVTAEKLRVEAQELLSEYQRKHKDAINEANAIVAEAKNQAEKIRMQAESDLDDAMKRRESQLNDRLERIEQQASQDIQAYTAKIAVDAARELMVKKLDSKSDKTIIESNLETVSKVLN